MNQEFYLAIESLCKVRPCFHSEADFQFALGWQIKMANPDVEVRREIPQKTGSRTYKLDLLFRSAGRRIAIELKYFKAPLAATVKREEFNLIDAVAHDISRYDFLKDVQRLEHVLASDLADEAYAVVLTNQPKYWESRAAGNRVDEAFGLEEGRAVSGKLASASHVGGTSKAHERPIQLDGRYELRWADYSHFPDSRYGRFRWLAVQATSGTVPPNGGPSWPKPIVQVLTARMRPNYQALADFLGNQNDPSLSMGFTEFEAITGALPRSARVHREWWANHAGDPQARWMMSGWKVDRIDLGHQLVCFRRDRDLGEQNR